MIETIDQITTDDLFNALTDHDFIRKLYDATQLRIAHHNDWTDFHQKAGQNDRLSREYHKTKGFMDLSGSLVRLLGVFRS